MPAHFRGIDGLRALAILGVIAFHTRPSLLQGGFIGVTMFFVITGFLATRSVLNMVDRTGSFGYGRYLIRRITRLWPVMLATIAVVPWLTWMFAPSLLQKVVSDSLPSALFASNWVYIFRKVPYFEAAGLPSPLTHLWFLGVTMQFAPESTCMMIASDILAENAPLSLPALRERINTPDGMVNTDLLFSRLIDNGTTPDPARIDMAMGILGPLEANAPTDACYRIIGLKAMLNLAMGDGEKARELAEQAIGYDASDRFASSVLDRLPETDPAMEAANVWENGGHLGR